MRVYLSSGRWRRCVRAVDSERMCSDGARRRRITHHTRLLLLLLMLRCCPRHWDRCYAPRRLTTINNTTEIYFKYNSLNYRNKLRKITACTCCVLYYTCRHYSAQHKTLTIAARVAWSVCVCVSVCVSAGHDREPCRTAE